MRRTILICSAIILLAGSAAAQKDKPWTEWTDREAQKVLTDSPWAQTQKELTDQGSTGPTITTAAENRDSANMVMGDAAKNAETKLSRRFKVTDMMYEGKLEY